MSFDDQLLLELCQQRISQRVDDIERTGIARQLRVILKMLFVFDALMGNQLVLRYIHRLRLDAIVVLHGLGQWVRNGAVLRRLALPSIILAR